MDEKKTSLVENLPGGKYHLDKRSCRPTQIMAQHRLYLGRLCDLYSGANGGQSDLRRYELQTVGAVHGHRLCAGGLLYVSDWHSKLRSCSARHGGHLKSLRQTRLVVPRLAGHRRVHDRLVRGADQPVCQFLLQHYGRASSQNSWSASIAYCVGTPAAPRPVCVCGRSSLCNRYGCASPVSSFHPTALCSHRHWKNTAQIRQHASEEYHTPVTPPSARPWG